PTQPSILPHTPSLCFTPFSLLLSIFSPLHSPFLSSFNYSVHQFQLFFSTFLSAFFDFTVLYPPFHFLYFLHAMSISFTLSIDHSNISFLQSIIFPIFTHSLSV